MDTETPDMCHDKCHGHYYVGSEPQWALGQYIILTAKAPK